MKSETILVIGKGEVGKAIYKICKKKIRNCYIRGRDDIEIKEKIDVLHICFPCIDNTKFEKQVINYIKKHNPVLTIIHSTIPPGTTRNISDKADRKLIAYSPIRGVHPKLVEGIQEIVKYVSATTKIAKEKARYHLQYELQLRMVHYFKEPEDLEMAKILSTTYYMWNIYFAKEVSELCKTLDMNFHEVYENWNSTYNTGYKKVRPNMFDNKIPVVQRPILIPVKGKVGGHCQRQNVDLIIDHNIDFKPAAWLQMEDKRAGRGRAL